MRIFRQNCPLVWENKSSGVASYRMVLYQLRFIKRLNIFVEALRYEASTEM